MNGIFFSLANEIRPCTQQHSSWKDANPFWCTRTNNVEGQNYDAGPLRRRPPHFLILASGAVYLHPKWLAQYADEKYQRYCN